MTTAILIILIAGAAVCMGFSVKLTIDMFKQFGSDSPAEERTAAIKKIRNRMIACYAGAALLVTLAALVKLLM